MRRFLRKGVASERECDVGRCLAARPQKRLAVVSPRVRAYAWMEPASAVVYSEDGWQSLKMVRRLCGDWLSPGIRSLGQDTAQQRRPHGGKDSCVADASLLAEL